MVSRATFIFQTAAVSTSALLMPAASQAAATDAPTSLTIGTFPIDTIGLVYYAQDLGYFKNAGFDVHFQTIGSGPQAAAAIAAGAIDIAVSNITTLAAAHLHGVDLKFIAASALSSRKLRTDLIMVANDSPVRKASDLNGKTIGIAGIKSMQQISAMSWVDKHGGDSKTLKFIEIPFPQMAATLEQHRADAALLIEPFVASATGLRSLGNVLDGVADEYMVLGYCASEAWLDKNASTAVRFGAVMRQTALWANAHQKESGEILARYAKLDPAVASAMARAVYGTNLNAALIQPVIDASAKYDVIDKSFPAAELIWQAPRA